MVEIVAIFLMACFCLVAGYLLGFVQRLVSLSERQVELLEALRKTLDTPAGDQGLPAGMYAMGAMDPKTGMTPLVPMRGP